MISLSIPHFASALTLADAGATVFDDMRELPRLLDNAV